MKRAIFFQYADAWLLLSIIYASKQKAASLAEIIACGDFANHTIFTWEELQGGIFRLINFGYVIEQGDKYKVSCNITNAYNKFAKKNKSVFKQLTFIRQELKSPEWSEAYNPSKANKGISYDKINKEVVKSAYGEYKRKFWNKTSNK